MRCRFQVPGFKFQVPSLKSHRKHRKHRKRVCAGFYFQDSSILPKYFPSPTQVVVKSKGALGAWMIASNVGVATVQNLSNWQRVTSYDVTVGATCNGVYLFEHGLPGWNRNLLMFLQEINGIYNFKFGILEILNVPCNNRRYHRFNHG